MARKAPSHRLLIVLVVVQALSLLAVGFGWAWSVFSSPPIKVSEAEEVTSPCTEPLCINLFADDSSPTGISLSFHNTGAERMTVMRPTLTSKLNDNTKPSWRWGPSLAMETPEGVRSTLGIWCGNGYDEAYPVGMCSKGA